MFGPKLPLLLLRGGLEIEPGNASEKSIWRSSSVLGQGIWLKKAVNVKVENFMAFQGRQRILSGLIEPNCVLPLMGKTKNLF